jgi:hypothetical protein
MEVASMRVLRVTAVIAGILAISAPSGLDSCAISGPSPVFATSQRPANLQKEFLKGRIGVLRRTYGQRYLIGAFRILSGSPLTQAEVESLYGSPSANAYPPFASPGLDKWIAARNALPGLETSPRVDHYKTVTMNGLLYSFVNCQQDAFFTAAATLANLSRTWGRGDAKAHEWARAQDQVFANCSGKEAVIPASPEANLDPLLAAHRRYQIAAALFYSGQFRKAAQAFQQVAEERESPWRGVARYMVARALLRARMFDGDSEAFREGRDRLLAILNDPAQSDWHEASLRLLSFWRLRMESRARLGELGGQLMKPGEEDVSQSVIDFLYLVNRREDETGRQIPESELAGLQDSSELAAWLFCMSAFPPAGSPERLLEWFRKTHNPAWLIAALANAQEKDLPELLPAARRIQPNAPGYESIAYYAIAREMARGRRSEARRWADRALSQSLLRSSRNLILAQRTELARDWNEFLRFALRRPEPNIVELEDYEVDSENTPIPTGTAAVFDRDAIHVFDVHAPLALWVDASGNTILPAHVRLRIAQAGWLRAVLLGRYEEARKLMQLVVELQPGAAEVAHSFLSAQNGEPARFAALYIILRSPSLRP